MYHFYNVSGSGKMYFDFSTSDKEFAEKELEVRKLYKGFAVSLPDGTWIEG